VYVGSKHAVEGITKSAAIELAGTGVRVNIVGPGPTETGMFNRFAQTKENKANFLETHIPTKRMGTPEEIANAIVFIGSDKASYIIGASLAVVGGMLAGYFWSQEAKRPNHIKRRISNVRNNSDG